MTDADFAFLRRFLKGRSGLDLGADKLYLAQSRLAPVCRDAGLGSLPELVARLRTEKPDRDLADAVVTAMATNETMFFRDRATFQALKEEVLPSLIAARIQKRRLRIWSAAAATGQEAYSVAMLMQELRPLVVGWTVEILATDISPVAIERARSGVYSAFEVQRGLPVRHLLGSFSQTGLEWTVAADLQDAVEFRVLNLLEDFSALGTFDLILCRNVAIYLDGQTKADLFNRLAGALAPDGVMCLGASETVLGFTRSLVPHPGECSLFVHAAAKAVKPVRLYGRT